MRLFGLTALAALAACRLGFDARVQVDAATPDAPPDAAPQAPPLDAPAVLGCTPARFAIDPATTYLTAVGTRGGFDVIAVNDTGVVRGYAFQFTGDKLALVAGTGTVLAVPVSIGPVAAVSLEPDPGDDADIAIAVPYAATSLTTTAGGTVVVPFDAELHRVDAPATATMNDGLVAGPGALAGGERGTIAYLGRDDSGHLALQAVSRRGVAIPGTSPVNTNDHDVTRQTLLRAASGYLAVWSDNALDPHEAVTAAAIDENLVAHDPVTISSNPEHGSFVPGAAYLPGAHRYLFGWMEKPAHDFIHLSLRDDQLALVPVSSPGSVPGELDVMDAEGTVPIIAAGDNDFLAVWPDTSRSPTLLKAVRVSPDGQVTPRGPTNTAGEMVAFDVISRNGQPVLFWVEKMGDGPNLWIDPLCQ